MNGSAPRFIIGGGPDETIDRHPELRPMSIHDLEISDEPSHPFPDAGVRAGIPGAGGARAPGQRPGQGVKKLTRAEFDAMMTTLSNWGRWGKDDQLGALNLITPEKRRQAAALVREGVSVSMAHLAIKEPMDGSPAFVHRMVAIPKRGDDISSAGDEYSVQYHGFTQTHLDGLCHLAYRGKMYNGFAQEEVTAPGPASSGSRCSGTASSPDAC